MTVWQSPPNRIFLGKEVIHIWRANLDLSSAQIARLHSVLSTDEIIRAERFRFQQHKKRFIAARGILRKLLSQYLEVNPKNLEFRYGERGKPELADACKTNDLQFNLSHSQELALFGFANYARIGVDIEHLKQMPEATKIAQRFFTPQEFMLVRDLVGIKQTQMFFRLWTAKEAYLKALGTGLSGTLSSFNIELHSNGRISLSSTKESAESTAKWFLCSCVPTSNYIGAIAVNSNVNREQICFWNFDSNLLLDNF